MRCFFRVEYDGRQYAGWQVQRNALSIQSALQEAFATVVRRPCPVTGAGRTDAGVHARAQGAHVDLPPDADLNRLVIAVNAVLPYDIAIYSLRQVDESFHARFSAIRRTYRYRLAERKSPLLHGRVWVNAHAIDWELVARESTALMGTHDFTAFCASGSGAASMTCSVDEARWETACGVRTFTISADRFIYKMVRSAVGTLIDIGRGRLSDSMAAVIASRDRGRAGDTAPPWGLTLDCVSYQGV